MPPSLKILLLLCLTSFSKASADVVFPRDLSKIRQRGWFYSAPAAGSSGRIIGGQEATPHEYPYVVALFIDELFFCGGAILDSTSILTAAHCLDGALNVEVVAGAHNIRVDEPEQQIRNSRDFIMHEDFSSVLKANDVAIIKLGEGDRLDFNAYVQPIARGPSEPPPGQFATFLGWGAPSPDFIGALSDVLQVTDELLVITDDECGEYFSDIADKTLCTGTPTDGLCNGDSGGPLVSNSGNLVGISSFGSPAGCDAHEPEAFSSVPDFKAWIDKNL